ncbi:MAG: SUMF1/EgtB/PvdO family nonheme iron enzyme [Candidatus Electronema sp. VV]
MNGYVWEWCMDWHSKTYYAECEKCGTIKNPQGPNRRKYRVLRGSSSFSSPLPIVFRSMYQHDRLPLLSPHYDFIGIRLALPFQEAVEARHTVSLPSATTPKPELINQIEKILNITLYSARYFPTPLDSLMAFKENYPKYFIDEQK